MESQVLDYLRTLSKEIPSSMKGFIAEFQALYDRKLWHPLTCMLLDFYQIQEAKPYLLPLYTNFIKDWETKMNFLSLVELASITSKTLQNTDEALAFLDSIAEKVKDEPTAHSYAITEAAQFRLLKKDLEGAKKALDASRGLIVGIAGLHYKIHASQYCIAAALDKATSSYSSYYKNALLYLGVVPLAELTQQERFGWAYDLAVSALLGDTIYNFGELLMNPILDSLNGTPYDWIKSLIYAFNTGDMTQFEAIVSSYSQDPMIASNVSFLKQKQCLMSLVEIIFKRGPNDRAIPFSEVSMVTKLPSFEVEFLVMKAMSLGLIRGKIDEVDQVLIATWVQPRVLGKDQVSSLSARIDEWKAKVTGVTGLITRETTEWLIPAQ